MANAVARWSGHKVKFDIESASGHTASIDEPPIFGDYAEMPPTEMLLGALGSCTGLNAVLLLVMLPFMRSLGRDRDLMGSHALGTRGRIVTGWRWS